MDESHIYNVKQKKPDTKMCVCSGPLRSRYQIQLKPERVNMQNKGKGEWE